VKRFARSLAIIAVVAAVVSLADPSSRPTVGRMAVFAVAVAAAAALTSRLARAGRGDASSPFEPMREEPPPPAVPSELAELASSLHALDAGRRTDGQLRSALESVARSRLRRHGLELDRPQDEAEVRRRLGAPLLVALRERTPPGAPEALVAPLEAL
jgi:hypothetical protein